MYKSHGFSQHPACWTRTPSHSPPTNTNIINAPLPQHLSSSTSSASSHQTPDDSSDEDPQTPIGYYDISFPMDVYVIQSPVAEPMPPFSHSTLHANDVDNTMKGHVSLPPIAVNSFGGDTIASQERFLSADVIEPLIPSSL